MNYFDRISDKLNTIILSYIDNINSFKNFYNSKIKSIRKLLDNYTFWENLLKLRFGKYLDYITPLIDRPKTNDEIKFTYRLIYYMKVVNSYIRSNKIIKNINNIINSKRNKYGTKEELEIIKNENSDKYENIRYDVVP